jgi:hypothetical protein
MFAIGVSQLARRIPLDLAKKQPAELVKVLRIAENEFTEIDRSRSPFEEVLGLKGKIKAQEFQFQGEKAGTHYFVLENKDRTPLNLRLLLAKEVLEATETLINERFKIIPSQHFASLFD